MRALVSSFVLIILLALAWALYAPVGAYWSVREFSLKTGATQDAEDQLIRAGGSALPALRAGLKSADLNTQYHSAKVLMVLGENAGEAFLLQMLRAHSEKSDGLGREAEAFLLSAWDRRDGPDDALRKKLREAESGSGPAPKTLVALNDILTRCPQWGDGYARRARLYQQGGEVHEARRDALQALTLAPNHFEALQTLGRIQLAVEAPQQAYKCFERALLVNPRLKNALKSEMEDALKLIEIERAKRREEKRKSAPVAVKKVLSAES